MGYPASARLQQARPEQRGSAGTGEIERLLDAYAQATSIYCASVARLREIRSSGSADDTWVAYCDADLARRRCEQVRLAVQMYFRKKIS
jgi:hypothetical protein